jgi:hypothetical protein
MLDLFPKLPPSFSTSLDSTSSYIFSSPLKRSLSSTPPYLGHLHIPNGQRRGSEGGGGKGLPYPSTAPQVAGAQVVARPFHTPQVVGWAEPKGEGVEAQRSLLPYLGGKAWGLVSQCPTIHEPIRVHKSAGGCRGSSPCNPTSLCNCNLSPLLFSFALPHIHALLINLYIM